MSWFSRVREFVEDNDILADDFDAEFDAIAEAFNGLFVAARVGATVDLVLSGTAKDVPGATLSVSPAIDSQMLVWPTWEFATEGETGVLSEPVGSLLLDGSAQPQRSALVAKNVKVSDPGILGGTFAQAYHLELNAGAHTVKLQAKDELGGQSKAVATHTGFTYLLLPG